MKNWFVFIEIYEGRWENREMVASSEYGPYEKAEAETILNQLRGRQECRDWTVLIWQTVDDPKTTDQIVADLFAACKSDAAVESSD
jgi:hypothetical protein